MNQSRTPIVIGSAQFGLDYGVTNTSGKVTDADLKKILLRATDSKIDLIDTAIAYGDAEARISKMVKLLGLDMRFRFVTKLSFMDNGFFLPDIKSLEHSLNILKNLLPYGLLIHDADKIPETYLEEAKTILHELKQRFGFKRAGISTYSPKVLEMWSQNSDIDLAQVPVNVLNQKFLNVIKNQTNIEFHVRSLFLQGILLAPKEKRPSYFSKFENILDKYDAAVERSRLSRLEFNISFGESLSAGALVIGVTSEHELSEIIYNRQFIEMDCSHLSSDEELIINPALWPTKNLL